MAIDDVGNLMVRGQQNLGQSGRIPNGGSSRGSWYGYGAGMRAPSSVDVLRRYASQPRQAQARGQVSAQDAFDQLRGQVSSLRREIQALQASGPGVLGGPVFGGNRDRNQSPFVDSPMVGVGGILSTDAIEIPAGAVAGTTVTAQFSGLQLAKLQGCVIELVSLVGASELQQEAERMQLTVSINNRQFRTLDGVPTDLIFPTALGEQQTIPAGVHVPSGAQVEFEIEVLTTLETDAAHTMFGRIYAGNGYDYAAWGS